MKTNRKKLEVVSFNNIETHVDLMFRAFSEQRFCVIVLNDTKRLRTILQSSSFLTDCYLHATSPIEIVSSLL